jgi:hypothetical protein
MGIKAMKDTHNFFVDWWKTGNMNLVGKIVFLPIIAEFYILWCLFDLLFTRENKS